MAFFRQDFVPPNGSISTISNNNSGLCANSVASNRMGIPFMPRMDFSIAPCSAGGAHSTDHSEERWQACAGPVVFVPQQGDRVWYFPQGHMEQVTASTHPGSCQKLPHLGLDSQILCRVVTRVLSAETDTDEVYAHISLLPEMQEGGDSLDITPQEAAPVPPKSSVRLFTKILTASDTSTHGGFSVLRKHAEECLPPLDMTQDPPSQDLSAKDLHGNVWKFRHTYRGHPRRHLLTTGWSVFVSNKRLLAGDAVIFLRGENGELRVGIRRAKRQQAAQQAVMSNHSMHMGVMATASHAVGTRTMFSVYYKPRVSLSAFLVPVDKLARAKSVSLSVGMRFKMRFETEDASDRSYAGTITGIEDLDASSFPDSMWRSLKVNWDEMVHDWQDRVSPWEIELSVSSPTVNSPPPLRNKRARPSPSATSTMTELTGLGSSKGPLDCAYTPRLQRVLQGQETRNMGISSLWRSTPHGLSSIQEAHYPTNIQQQLGNVPMGQSLPLPSPRASFYTPFVSGTEADFKHSGPISPSMHGGVNHSLLQGSNSGWPTPSNEATSKWFMSFLPQHPSPSTPIRQEKSLVTGNVPVAPAPQLQHHHPLSYPPFSSFPMWETPKQESPAASMPPPVVAESGCKLFGISLTDIPPGAKSNKANNLPGPDCEEVPPKCDVACFQPNVQSTEHDALTHIKSDASSEQERLDQNTLETRTCHSTRSRTKVIKKGSMVGRGIDLTKFDSYGSLLKELEAMFSMEGELTDPEKGWQVAYSDSEGDTMKVGDDPWREFCNMVKKLYILSPEEVEQGGNRTTLKEALPG
uniref:Auxin response factor n=1 Tax=Cyrtomium guizhouense TaxID=306076 RepID=A0A1X9T674_9MONI|nr:auxin response factor 2 [Cyrtomium guizhouense]